MTWWKNRAASPEVLEGLNSVGFGGIKGDNGCCYWLTFLFPKMFFALTWLLYFVLY